MESSDLQIFTTSSRALLVRVLPPRTHRSSHRFLFRYIREMMDMWDEEVIEGIGAYLKPGGKKAFEARLRVARAA